MKWFALIGMAAAGALAWQIGERLSSDAISMGLGVMFGVLAGVPTAVLVLASGRRREPERRPEPPQQPQAPVIVITAGAQQALPHDVRYQPPARSYTGALHGLTAPSEQTRHEHYYEIEQTRDGEIIRRGGVRRKG